MISRFAAPRRLVAAGCQPAGAEAGWQPAATACPVAAKRHAALPAMSKEDQLRDLLACGIVAVVRSPDSAELVEVARALVDGGVSVVEITMSVPDALDVLRCVRRALGDRLLLGAGTILDTETA